MGRWSLLAWTGQPIFIAGSLLLPFATAYLQAKSNRNLHISWFTLVALALICFGLPVVLQFPAWWSMGGWPPPRTVDAIFFVFLCGWILLISALSLRWLPLDRVFDRSGQMHGLARLVFLLLATLFVAAIVVNSRFQRAWDDLQNHALPFQQYQQHRHTLIQQSRDAGQNSVEVPAYDGQFPRSIFFNDIRSDWRDWRNLCYARYFGLHAIQLARGQSTLAPTRQNPAVEIK